MALLAADAKLGLALRFEVVIDDIPLGGWSKCEGLTVTWTFKDWAEGGTNDYMPILPDRLKYDNIKLTRALNKAESTQVMSYLARMAQEFKPGTGQITLLDSHKGEVASWRLRNVYPAKWTGPSLDAMSKNVATEMLELKHEGFLED